MMAKAENSLVIWRAAMEKNMRENAFAYTLTASAAIALKYRFSKASAEELYWLVAPLARLIELLAGIRFDWEPPNGFISTAFGAIIAPACSGVTFLAICFCTLSFSLVHRRQIPIAKLGWIALSLFTAYLVTLGANAVRIIAAIVLYQADIYGEWITPARVHRMVGIAVYLSVLLPVYLTAERMTRVRTLPPGSRLLEIRAYCPPFVWYILFTTMIPVLRTLGRNQSALLTEHALVVGIASAAALTVCLGLNRSYFRASPKRIDLAGGEREDDRDRRFYTVGTTLNAAKNVERKREKAQEAAKR